MTMSLGRSGKAVQNSLDSTLDLLAATPDIWTAEKIHSYNQIQTKPTAIPSILLIGCVLFFVALFGSVIPALLLSVLFSPRVVPISIMASHERRVLLIGDAGVGKSSLIAVRNGHRPFFDKYTPYFSHASFEQSVTNLGLGWWPEGGPDLLKTTRKTLKRKGLKSIRQTRLHVLNLNPAVPLQRSLPQCCQSSVAAVIFCFSIGDECSFENIKNKVNWASLNNLLGLQITRANVMVRSVVPHSSALPPGCSNVAPWHEERPTRPCWGSGNQWGHAGEYKN